MKFNLYNLFFFCIFFIIAFIFGAIKQSFSATLLLFLIFVIAHLNWIYSLILAIIISGILNFIFNRRVFMESLIVEVRGKDGLIKFWDDTFKERKDNEKVRSSVPIMIGDKTYRVIEFAEYFF